MQAQYRWKEPAGILGVLVREARERASRLENRRAELAERASMGERRSSFAEALRRPDVAVIAEIKRRSPSRGELNSSMDVSGRSAGYAAAGAAALSILTQGSHFGGDIGDLAAARRATMLPLLSKDFHVSPVQLVEAAAAGASAVLLIARALPPAELADLAAEAAALGIEALIEVRREEELALAIDARTGLIGVNNRDLETLVIDTLASARLIPMVPTGFAAIYESGVVHRGDVERAAALGADAVLVGSSLSRAADPMASLDSLLRVPRTARGCFE